MENLKIALLNWRKERDNLFKKYNLDIETVYNEGNFENLPTECLIAVCYVDAYNCAINLLNAEND